MASESVPVALISLVRRNRRRYGGYLVHLGVITLFVGVAASSVFQKASDVQLRPGQSTIIGDYQVTYEKPTSRVVAAGNGRLERIDFGAVLKVRHGGRDQTVITKRSYFPTTDPSLGPISGFFEGEATSEVGLRAGLLRDVWTVVSPSLADLRPAIEQGDKVFSGPGAKLSARERNVFLAQALDGLAKRYADDPPPATFRLLVSPLVTWIWLGALLVLTGGLVAIWPGPRPRMVRAQQAARVASELGRA
jgi:cytochrome c-type biogenesis protein CcmF